MRRAPDRRTTQSRFRRVDPAAGVIGVVLRGIQEP